MKKEILIIFCGVLLLLNFNACNSGDSVKPPDNSFISTDTAAISAGKGLFTQQCAGCHNFKQNGIGPALGGITAEVSAQWIEDFIRDPAKLIKSGDKHATELLDKYKVTMPSFPTLTKDELNGIIAFMHTKKKPKQYPDRGFGKELSDPIPDSIKFSGLIVGVKLVAQFPFTADSGKSPKTRITKLGFEPSTGNSFVVDLQGRLYKLQNNKPIVYMDIASLRPKFINKPGLATGFGSFAFHPDFQKNGLLYTTHSEAAGSAKADFGYPDSIKVALQWVLTEWKTDKPGAATFSGKGRELLRANMVSQIHGVQEIIFNPLAKPHDSDYGLLYVGVGDGGSVEAGYPFLAHDKDKVWGTVLRIDPRGNNSANGQYGIPKSNPFAGANTRALGEIYAYGFRNPHRITWSKSGQMLVCNVGQGSIESVNLVMPGHDYGWPTREGNFLLDPYGDLTKVYPLRPNDSTFNITYPIAEYDHNGGVGAISGGYEYWGKSIPQLQGKFLFGDIPLGKLFFIETADIKLGKLATIREWKISFNGSLKTIEQLCGSDRADLHFGRDAQGELYILTKPDGKLYKLESATTAK